MGIENYFDKLFVVRRASWKTDESSNSYSEEAEIGQFMGHIQEASAEFSQSLGMTLTKPETVWCGILENVKAGDTLESVDGVYSVKGLRRFDLGGNQHLQLVVEKSGEVIGS